MSEYIKIGKTIKILRIKNGIKQKELAEILGISVNYLSLVENDKRTPSLSLMVNIANTLNVSLLFLLAKELENERK